MDDECEKEDVQAEVTKFKKRSIPHAGDGQKIYEIDSLLKDYRTHLDFRWLLLLLFAT